mmetsp:Transcript_8905/g.16939  ORF Transcript_8905/g.16939 Transcript_8905/m.16939 type:complete len:285 (-) Transcript_8905:255-1109(-)
MDSDDHLRGVPKQHTPTIASEMVTTRDEKMKNMRKKNGGSSSTSGDKTTPITTTTTTTTRVSFTKRWAHTRTILRALFLRGDYVSVKYGGSKGMVVASCISFSPGAISAIFLLLCPIGFYSLPMLLGTLLVACLGALLHAGASAFGVGYGFNTNLSLCSHLLGVSLTGAYRMYDFADGNYARMALALSTGALTAWSGLYTYAEMVCWLSRRLGSHQGSASESSPMRKSLLYPINEFRTHIYDILQSPPLKGRRRGDQYYINKAAAMHLQPPGAKLAHMVGVVND